MHHNSSTEAEQTKFDAPNIQQSRIGFIDDVKVMDLVFSRAEFLQHSHVFASTPDSVDGDIESELSVEKHGKLGEGKLRRWESLLDWGLISRLLYLFLGIFTEKG
jgi:hypothetical protein